MIHNCILLLTPVLKIAIASLVLLAAMRDIMTRTVPNWIPMTMAVFCTALAVAGNHLIFGLGFGLAVFVICFVFWNRGWMGGADVKLLGAAAIAVAPMDVEAFLLGVTLFGGLLSMAYLTGGRFMPRPAAGRPGSLMSRVLRVESWRIRHRGPLPYACAIAAGTLFVLS
jgi:prepilin peptidase CpaA